MKLWLFLPLLGASVAGILALTVWLFPTTGDFRDENPFWNGLEDFRREFNAEPLDSLQELPAGAGVEGSIVIVIPYVAFEGKDVNRLRSYIERGGVVVIADDYGYGNTILEGFGIPARFANVPLIDPLFNYRTSAFPLATEFEPSPLTAEVSSLALNYATGLDAEGLTTIARSSSFSYLDLNNSGSYDATEPLGPVPVVGHTRLGSGDLFLLADPSLFISSMLGAADNLVFLRNLMKTAGEDATVFVDQSHLPPSRLDETKTSLAAVRKAGARPEVLAGATALLIIVLIGMLLRSSGSFERMSDPLLNLPLVNEGEVNKHHRHGAG